MVNEVTKSRSIGLDLLKISKILTVNSEPVFLPRSINTGTNGKNLTKRVLA